MLNKLREAQRNFGIFGAVGFFITVSAIAIQNWQGTYLTLSQHIALSPISSVIFGFINTLTTTLIAICLLSYIAQRWNLGRNFKLLSTIIVACLYIIGWFPHLPTETLGSTIHQAAAWVLMCTIAVFAVYGAIRLWNRADRYFHAATIAYFLIAAASAVLYFCFYQTFREYVFIVESSYILVFFCLILSMVYAADTSKLDVKKRLRGIFKH
ncbi:MAG: hypothetical protein LBK50_00330 [Candidatus Nomurabacteria bacterium]|jgi:hypothetical protein|nr:hypothetical protein [Candidatus Nomurabacteria bacterium]